MRKLISLFVSALFAVAAWAEEPLSGEYVDLGLSVKWATCNLGATSSTAAGWYLAWGETSTKANYTWGTYLSNLGGTMTESKDAGTEKDPLKEYVKGGANYSEGIGATAYDAATAALGAGYRMPTQTEFAELANTDNCEWVWYDEDNTEFNGVAGYKVTSKKTGYTGNSIFIPAAGCHDGGRLRGEGSYGSYWSSTPNPDTAVGAYGLYFDSYGVSPNDGYGRSGGFPVRPVYAAIAQIGETIYTDVEEFMNAVKVIDGKATVKLLGNITLPEDMSIENLKMNADITLDLNGHNITGNYAYNTTLYMMKLAIVGNGIVKNDGEGGDAIGSYGTVAINDGTYIGTSDVCYVHGECTMIVNGGKFKGLVLFYEGTAAKPIVKGGIFSMDPTDCVAEGYEAVANDDEDTKADYPYKVVEKSLTPTAIDAVNADKSGKAIKTIENGRVVIIRDNKKFDLSGREL